MKKKLLVFIALLCAALFFILLVLALISQRNLTETSAELQVVTTLFPLYDFSKNIGHDHINVSLLLPPGVEPHSFEPKPSDVVAVNKADVFVYTGKFMEVWAQDILNGVTNPHLEVVDDSIGIQLIPAVFHDEDEPAGSNDPHIWMDFANAQTMVDTIASALIVQDPAHTQEYLNNAAAYKNELQALDKEYRDGLSACRKHTIVYAGHYAFGYLARRYGFSYIAAQGVSPDSEPTAADLIKLVKQIKAENISFIFYEELTSPKIAQTVAEETGAQLLLLNAAHNVSRSDLSQEVSFLSIMRQNLANLKQGLNCEANTKPPGVGIR